MKPEIRVVEIRAVSNICGMTCPSKRGSRCAAYDKELQDVPLFGNPTGLSFRTAACLIDHPIRRETHGASA